MQQSLQREPPFLCSVLPEEQIAEFPFLFLPAQSSKLEKVYVFDVPSLTYICADSSPFDENSFEAVSEYLRFLVQFSGLYSPLTVPSQTSTGGHRLMADQEAVRNERYATSNTRLNPDLTLAFYQINT